MATINSARALALILLVGAATCAGATMSLGEKAMLQASMQTHIDRVSVDGDLLQIDPDTGRVEPLRAKQGHPIILRMGDVFVLCASFESRAGKDVNINFFVARRGKGFIVFDHELDDGRLIQRMMEAGKMTRVE